MKTSSSFIHIINGFARKRILVIGDLLLDIYLKGQSTRLCPEAPVPVVDVQERTVLLGGAANTVCNLRALGASVTFCSVIGNDVEGDEALQLMQSLHLSDKHILRSDKRKTITKARIVSGSQVITRIDQGSEDPVDDDTTAQLIVQLKELFPLCDAVIVSDYDKGVITEGLLDTLIALQSESEKFIAVDSKRLAFFSRLMPSYAKPNYDEVVKLLGLQPAQDRLQQIRESALALYDKIGAPLISVTLDKDGCMILENGNVTGVVPAPLVEKPFVAGAGDSFISAFVLSYMNTSRHDVSAEIATAAAAIAIRKEGTAVCSLAELRSYFQIHSKWIQGLNDLAELCESYRRDGRSIVFTNGCFDILHS
ncbi:MAG TPA: PfkB family carbohydrate kinase, partial [Chryseosolibacter sp.]|nr:PfkB family carbohydrate kinase [Chryseosolibacter sp.]